LATKTTDNLTQGSTNLYFTNSLAKSASVVNSMAGSQEDQAPSVSSVKAYYTAGTGIALSSGQISSTITQYTDTDADARITLQKGANNGICELDANGLVPTNHLPPLAITDVHVVADEAARLALVAQEGDVAIQTDDSSSWIYDGSAWVAFGVSGAVVSVNGQTGTVSLDSDDVSEGSTNLYYTSTRVNSAFDTRLATKTTDNLTEGSTNLYFTSTRFDNTLATKTTDNLGEGSTNLYFTNTRFDNRLSTKTTDNLSEGSTNLYYTSTRVNGAFDTRLATKTTDDLTEGSTNLYFTTARARSSFSAGSNITIVDGQISASTGGGSRPTISDKTSNFTISTPSASTLQEIYTVSGSSAVTMTLPDATACTGMRYDIKRLGTATTTIACNGSQTIDTLSTIQLLAQYASVTVISTGTNWIII
jgi:hypothetical protein